jgi:membrane protease YdiL (CAAX protease family)
MTASNIDDDSAESGQVIDSSARSKYANAATARSGFFFLAPLAAFVAILTFVSSPILSVLFAASAVVLVMTGRDCREESITGRWNWLDVLAVLALLGIVLAYGGIFKILGSSQIANSAATILVYACVAAAIFFVVSVRRGAHLRDLGWRLPAPKWYLAVPVVVIAGNLISSFVLNLELHTTIFHGAAQTQCTDTQSSFGTNLLGFIVAIPAVAIAPAIVEETLFRGFLYGWMVRLIKPDSAIHPILVGAAVLASAMIFGIFHATFGTLYILPLATVGLLLTALYQWSGSLVPGVLAHALFNTWGLFEILLTKSSC